MLLVKNVAGLKCFSVDLIKQRTLIKSFKRGNMSNRTTPRPSREKLIEAVKQESWNQACMIAYELPVSRARIMYLMDDCVNIGIIIPEKLMARTASDIPPGFEAETIPEGMVLTQDRFHCPKCKALLIKTSQVCSSCGCEIRYHKNEDSEQITWRET